MSKHRLYILLVGGAGLLNLVAAGEAAFFLNDSSDALQHLGIGVVFVGMALIKARRKLVAEH